MNLNEMVEHATRILQDEEFDTWTPDEMVSVFDQVHRAILAERGTLEDILTLEYDTDRNNANATAYPDFAFYRFPETFVELKQQGLHMTLPSKRVLRPRQLVDMAAGWEDRTGSPTEYLIGLGGDYRSVRLYPYPNTVAATVKAYCSVAAPSLTLLTAPLMPLNYHIGLVYDAVGELLDRSPETRDMAAARMWRAKASSALAPYRASAARKHDGTPVTVKGRKF